MDSLHKKINDKQIRFIEDGIPSRWDQKSMTHDELLKKVETDQEITEYLNNGLINGDITVNTARQHWFQSNALGAVVKRHTPEHSIRGYRCKIDDELYPCAEVQAIEKELV